MISIRLSPTMVTLGAITFIVLLSYLQSEANAMQCTRKTLMGNLEVFNCPSLFDKGNKQYCCGTESNRYCCKLSKAREHGYRSNNMPGSGISGQKIVSGLVGILLTVLLVVGGCIALCCFCVCYVLRKKRSSAGHVIGGGDGGMIAGQSVHVVPLPVSGGGGGGYPTQPSYPSAQPSYPQYPASQPSYPSQPAPYPSQPTAYPAYPMSDVSNSQPPPYPTQPPFNPNYPQ